MEERMEPKRDEVGVRLDDGLQERVGAYASLEDLQRELRDLKQMVDVLGPAALGTQRILTHWAAQTGGLRVSEDELLAEGRLVADEEWQGQLAERDRKSVV